MIRHGWTNVDSHAPADVQGDFRKLDFSDAEEVLISHALEHIPWADVLPTLKRIRSWMRPDAKITVEVPDMRRIAPEVDNPWWVIHVYGIQSNPGEFHRCGFTETSLEAVLVNAEFHDIVIRWFDSEHPNRPGMPCLEAVAFA